MTCRLDGAKPFSKPMLDIVNWTLRNKLQWYFNQNSNISTRKCRLRNGVHFVSASMCWPWHDRVSCSFGASVSELCEACRCFLIEHVAWICVRQLLMYIVEEIMSAQCYVSFIHFSTAILSMSWMKRLLVEWNILLIAEKIATGIGLSFFKRSCIYESNAVLYCWL